MDKNEYFIYNNNLYPASVSVLSPNNRSFKYGDGFFETMKMINGSIIFENFHFERLFSSLQTLQFEAPSFYTQNYFLQKIHELIEKNNHHSFARIRLTVFRGDGNLYDDNNDPNYTIQSWELPLFPVYNKTGMNIGIYKAVRKSCDAFSNIKSNNYLPYAMASIWCKKNGFDDALVLNGYNRMCEATTSNLFIVKDGVIKTPAFSEGCIAGVTRKYLLQCFERENITCEQTSLTKEDICHADEMFLTNSGFYIQWIKQCGTKLYTNKTAKDLYQRFILPLLKGYGT